MTYRELLKLYKTGKLEEKQRREIAADIEKQDAIAEYLFEESEIPGADSILTEHISGGDHGGGSASDTSDTDGETSAALDEAAVFSGNSPDDQGEEKFVQMIQRSIRRAFVKMGVTVGAVVLAIVLCAVFLLPRIVSLFYYNPSAVVGKNEENEDLVTDRMSLDMAVYSELFLPGAYRNNVAAESRGYGVYDITIVQNASFNDRFTDVTGRLVRGKLTLYNTNVLKRPVDNVFLLPDEVKGSANIWHEQQQAPVGAAGTAEEALDKLQSLPDGEYYLAYVSLDEITDYETVYQWFEDKDMVYGMMWYGVYAEDESGYFIRPNIGFTPHPSGMSLDWDRDAYPLLSYLDNSDNQEEADPGDAATMQTHFTSLLNYLTDHKEIWEMMTGESIENVCADDILRYVDEHGLKTYGFALGATKETLLKLAADPMVSYIYTTPMQ